MNQLRKEGAQLLVHLSKSERDVIDLIAKRKPLEQITEKIGLPRRTIEGLIHSARFALGANDDLVDNYLALLDEWEQETGSTLYANFDFDASEEVELVHGPSPADKTRVVDQIEKAIAPDEMRALAGSLLRLAEAFDQGCSPEDEGASPQEPSNAAKVETSVLEKAKRASVLIRQRQLREEFLPEDLFGEPAWNMLLDLFVQFAGGVSVSGKSLCIAARCSQSTALRQIAKLEKFDLIKREPCHDDGRVTLFSLTKRGLIAVSEILERTEV